MMISEQITLTEQRRKILIKFIIEKSLVHEYTISHYKTPYMFIRYNYLSEFRKWLSEDDKVYFN